MENVTNPIFENIKYMVQIIIKKKFTQFRIEMNINGKMSTHDLNKGFVMIFFITGGNNVKGSKIRDF